MGQLLLTMSSTRRPTRQVAAPRAFAIAEIWRMAKPPSAKPVPAVEIDVAGWHGQNRNADAGVDRRCGQWSSWPYHDRRYSTLGLGKEIGAAISGDESRNSACRHVQHRLLRSQRPRQRPRARRLERPFAESCADEIHAPHGSPRRIALMTSARLNSAGSPSRQIGPARLRPEPQISTRCSSRPLPLASRSAIEFAMAWTVQAHGRTEFQCLSVYGRDTS